MNTLLLILRRARRQRSVLNSERYALTMLGYAYGSRRSIDVSPQSCPVNDARPLALEAGAGAQANGCSDVQFTG